MPLSPVASPMHRRIIDFRNVIAHGYDGLDNDVVWQAVVDKLPVLLAEARSLLDEIVGTG